ARTTVAAPAKRRTRWLQFPTDVTACTPPATLCVPRGVRAGPGRGCPAGGGDGRIELQECDFGRWSPVRSGDAGERERRHPGRPGGHSPSGVGRVPRGGSIGGRDPAAAGGTAGPALPRPRGAR